MQECENVKQALQAALELADAKVIKVDGSVATTAQLQELFKESLISIADLLGIEELYLESKKQPQAIVSSEGSFVKIVVDGKIFNFGVSQLHELKAALNS